MKTKIISLGLTLMVMAGVLAPLMSHAAVASNGGGVGKTSWLTGGRTSTYKC